MIRRIVSLMPSSHVPRSPLQASRARVRRSTRGHVIRWRRSQQQLEGFPETPGVRIEGLIPAKQTARGVKSLPAQVQAGGEPVVYDQAYIRQNMKLPSFEEAPSKLRMCFHRGVLSFPVMMKGNSVPASCFNETVEAYERSIGAKWVYRLSFNFATIPQFEVLGAGSSRVSFLRIYWLVGY
jgi:hypothetical protein